mgnify:CR=1 FL=1
MQSPTKWIMFSKGDILFYDNNYAIGIVKDIEEQQNKLVIGCIVEGYGVNLAKFDPSGIEIPRIYNIATFGELNSQSFYQFFHIRTSC